MKKIIILIALIASCVWATCEKQIKEIEVNGESTMSMIDLVNETKALYE